MPDTAMQLPLDSVRHAALPRPGTLYPFQAEAVTACLAALERGEHPVLALPTGSGKSHIIAALCATLPGRILVVTHRRELIRQDHAKHEGDDAGIYSSGLGIRDVEARVIYAGIASIYRRMDELQAAGHFDYVITDECHRCPPPSQESMYGTAFAACPLAQRIGLSATPYRLGEGLLHEGAARWFDSLPVDVSIRALTPQYLAPLVGVLGAAEIDVSQVKVRMGEYVTSELAHVACEADVVDGAVREIGELTRGRRQCLLFCVDVEHTRLVWAALRRQGHSTAYVVGTTPGEERDRTLEDFAAGAYKFLCNCEVLTTGFDCPDIDCIVLLRPTQSKGLLVQMLGRGCRLAKGKTDCLVLDYSGNLQRHAPLDDLTSLRKSAARAQAEAAAMARAQAEAAAMAREAAERERRARHAREASLADPWGTRAEGLQTYRVSRVTYKVVNAKRFPGRQMLLATYTCPERLAGRALTQFVLVEHDGWAREQAEAWASRRGYPLPRRAQEVLRAAWRLPTPTEIMVREGAWPKVVLERFAEEGT